MTPDDWKYVADRLSGPFGGCRLVCDGYEVSLQVEQVKKLKLGIVVYVNGKLKYAWLYEDCQERNRFMRRIDKPLLTPSEQKAEKRLAKLCKRPSRHDKKYTYWLPYWTNTTALHRHFCKHNTAIKLVRSDV